VLERAGTREPEHPTRPEIRLLDPAFYADPEPLYAWMRKEAPVYWDDHTGIWGITRYEDIMAVARDHKTFCSGQGSRPESLSPQMINSDPPEHDLRRGIIRAGFTPRRVQAHESYLRDKVRQLIDAVAERGSCDFVRDLATPLPMYMIGELMGLPEEDHERLLHWSDIFASGNFEDMEALTRAARECSAYFRPIIEERRGSDGEDLISLVANARIDGRGLSMEDLFAEVTLILVGGDETTRHVMSGGLEALMRDRAQWEALRTDRALLKGATEEMLRWVTPVKNMNRTATRDVELGGRRIREGDKMLLLYHSGNRDERVFADSERFDIRRFPNDHLAFGGYGRHHCLGAALARLELRVLFDELLDRLPEIDLADPEAPLDQRRGNFVLGLETLPVVF
jgi:cytochrome P450 family 142 subfamily A polypeptide 1